MADVLERRFAQIGARVKVKAGPRRGSPRIDVARDGRGEYFELRFTGNGPEIDVEVVDVAKRDRHLLLLVRGDAKSKFLCGHDERHWFVAAIPESARGVTGVAKAKVALQPDAVRAAVERHKPKDPFRRRNAAYLRQGEWFFVPARHVRPKPGEILRNEILTRGRGKNHVMELACRLGGRQVYVNRKYRSGLTREQFEKLPREEQVGSNWSLLVRDARVYANGSVRHPDHATLVLPGWHEVLMNTEQGARAMQHVVFID